MAEHQSGASLTARASSRNNPSAKFRTDRSKREPARLKQKPRDLREEEARPRRNDNDSEPGPPGARLLRFQDLKRLKSIPFSRVHVDRLTREGRFPQKVHIGFNTTCWLESEIDAYIAERIAARPRITAKPAKTQRLTPRFRKRPAP